MALPERYRGRPILLIIENYALAVIGALPPDKLAGMVRIVQPVWGGGDDWMATVRAQLDWSESMDETIRKNWIRYQEAARTQNAAGSPVEFAMQFADAVEQACSPPS